MDIEDFINSHISDLKTDNPFWDFSLTQWQNPELKSLLLLLQDTQHYRINNILFSLWITHEKKRLTNDFDVTNTLARQWNERFVVPLRNTRNRLPDALRKASIRKSLLESEISAEQIEQAILYRYGHSLAKNSDSDMSELDLLVCNLFASQLRKTDLLLIVKCCFPNYKQHTLIESVSRWQ